MWSDPIVEEVRRVREEHAAKFDYDIGRIVSDVKERERKSGREVIPAPMRRLGRVGREHEQTT